MRFATVGLFLLLLSSSGVAELQISEFMAANAETLPDADGDFSDWIEIHNPDGVSVPLIGHYLTDDPQNLTKWSFPEDAAISGGGYVIVFASSKDRADEEWHTNFSLDADGDSVLLVSSEGRTIIDAFQDYPDQRSGFSYSGLFHAEPTPGSPNGDGVVGFVADTKFSVDRGFYDDPIVVEISSDTPDARILYTTDGSEPSIFSGKVYTEPISISDTTILRALARKGNYLDSNLDTQTYIFLDDVLEQDGEGLPTPSNPAVSDWDYEMDPDVVMDPRYTSTLKDDLKKLRTMSVVMPVNDLWSGRGLYANPTQLGPDWERACSVEILDPNDPAANVQEDAGLRIQGAGSRFRNLGKKSMRLAFRSKYGAGSFRYPLFGETQPSNFDTIVLRGSYFDSWTVHAPGNGMGIGWRNALQFRTDFGHLTHRDMGAHGILSDWVHLYLNGQYWGIYNIHERPDEAFAALHLGGTEEDYDVLKQRPRGQANGSTPELVNGSLEAWQSLMDLIRQDISDDDVYQDVLTRIDLDQFIDYILMNLWGGNQDWPHNNWYAIRHRPSNGPFNFYTWDPENYLFDVNVNQTGANTNNSPGILFGRLRTNADFRLRFADRVHRHLFNDGALSVAANTKRFQYFADRLRGPMNAESARWGDTRTEPPLNTVDTWLPTVDKKLNDYLPRRHDIVLAQLTAADLYPTVEAPEISQHGGDVEAPYTLTLPTSLFSETFYTLDGSDPSEGEAILYTEPIVLTESTVVKTRRQSNQRWSALTEAWFRLGTVDASSDHLEISEIQPRGESEFLELANTSDQIVDLSGVRFARGIRFTYAGRTTILPQGKIVLVRNTEAFAAHYPGRIIAGEYLGSLNNGGERLLLVNRHDVTILDQTYGENGARFVGDPDADKDGDGLSALLEYALNTNDEDPGSGPGAISVSDVDDEIIIQFTARPDTPDLRYEVEVSTNLSDWDSGAGLALEDGNVDGTHSRRFQIPRFYQYVRLKVALD